MILREGDDELKGAAAGCLALIAADQALAELIYTSGAGKVHRHGGVDPAAGFCCG
jgi:hypothetical protein